MNKDDIIAVKCSESAKSYLMGLLDHFLAGNNIATSFNHRQDVPVIHQGHFSNLIAEVALEESAVLRYRKKDINGARLWYSRLIPEDGYPHCKHCLELEFLSGGCWYSVSPDNNFPAP